MVVALFLIITKIMRIIYQCKPTVHLTVQFTGI